MTVVDLVAHLEGIWQGRSSVLPAAILADELDNLPLEPVDRGKFPNWLRLQWVRTVDMPILRNSNFYSANRRSVDAWSISQEMQTYVDLWRSQPVLDHCGTTTVAGLPCWISEPYSDPLEVWPVWTRLARRCRTVPAFSRASSWNPTRTCRLLLFPLARLTASPRRRQSALHTSA